MNANTKTINVAYLLLFLLLSYSSLVIYMDYSYLWASLGKSGRIFTQQFYWIEIPLILSMLLILYFPQVKNRLLRFALPLIPVLVLYLLFDLFYNQMIRIPLPSDFQNLTAIFSFDLTLALFTVAVLSSIPISLVLLLRLVKVDSNGKAFLRTLLIRSLIIILLFYTLTSDKFIEFHRSIFNYSVWSQEDTIKENGKFSSFIYYANQEYKNGQQLKAFKNNGKRLNIHDSLFPGEIKNTKNIHMIALESFIDPRLLKNISFSRSVLSSEIIPYLNNQKDFSFVTSPIYGGGTAQAEFELLTGIKALSKVNQIEFNVMQGEKTSSFVNKLNQSGYQTLATIAASSSFFNSKQAYKSLDFNNVTYIEEQNSFMRNNGEGPIFDGDLFDFNISELKQHLSTSNKPVFNYMLGMYGHMPFARDEVKRPNVSKVSHVDEKVKRISNQFYYRTLAISKYIKQLIRLDPNSIIMITSDHLPSILGEEIVYTLNNKINIALFIENGRTIDISGKHLYEIPLFIWDRLSGTDTSRIFSEETTESLYYTLLSQSQMAE